VKFLCLCGSYKTYCRGGFLAPVQQRVEVNIFIENTPNNLENKLIALEFHSALRSLIASSFCWFTHHLKILQNYYQFTQSQQQPIKKITSPSSINYKSSLLDNILLQLFLNC
jgi:hypothetical protein